MGWVGEENDDEVFLPRSVIVSVPAKADASVFSWSSSHDHEPPIILRLLGRAALLEEVCEKSDLLGSGQACQGDETHDRETGAHAL